MIRPTKTKTAYSSVLAVVILGSWVIAQEQMPVASPLAETKNSKELTSHYCYAIGLNIGQSLRQEGVPIDRENLLAGIKDGLEGAQPKFEEQTLQLAMKELGRLQSEAHLNRNKEFLAKNRQHPDVKVMPSGLQYQVLKQGDGPKPKLEDTVAVHYTGRFIDGSVFDSSLEGGQPMVTTLTGVITGWTEALSHMQVGSKWLIVVPSELAYGEAGRGPIPPHTTLVFEMELLRIVR